MQTRELDGRTLTNKAGAAEILDRSVKTVEAWASPAQRQQTGWPPIADRHNREEWYDVACLEAFRDSFLAAKVARNRPAWIDPDAPDELLSAAGVRALLNITYGTWTRYVADSMPRWKRGEDGYLPRPDDEEPATRGMKRFWWRSRIAAWNNQTRRGRTAATGRPPRRTDQPA